MADRDAHAENVLVSHFYRPVQLKLRARLRSPELIQDASQETFLRVLSYFRSGKTLENPASLPGFVRSVCRNIALEFLRAHARHDQMPETVDEPTDRSPSAEGQMISEERTSIVRRILGELPERDRELLRRVLLEEEDKDLVCRELQIDRNYLRVLLHRARLRFKAQFLESGAQGAAHGGV